MEIKYKSNLVAGIVSIILGIVCIILVPLQIAEDYSATYGITSRTIPGAIGTLGNRVADDRLEVLGLGAARVAQIDFVVQTDGWHPAARVEQEALSSWKTEQLYAADVRRTTTAGRLPPHRPRRSDGIAPSPHMPWGPAPAITKNSKTAAGEPARRPFFHYSPATPCPSGEKVIRSAA